MRLQKPAVVVATAAALVTLAACGGGSGNSNSSGDPTLKEGGNAGSFKNAEAKAPVAVPSDASQGGTLTVLTSVVPSTLDPTQAYFTDSTAILSDLVLRSLTQYAYDEKSNDMQLIPDMATDLGKPSADNKEWTFTLRDGLKYEDGTPVKAEDVAYAVKRSFAIAELPDGPTYQTTFFLDGDKYKGPFKDKGQYKGVEVKGNDITIKMRRPFTDMDYYASFPAFTAIPQAKDNPETYGKKPLATGPYKFSDYKPGSELKLVKNDQWDPASDPGRIQAVDGWDFKFGQDTAKLENIIINDQGSAQTTLTYDNVSASSYRQIASEKDRLVTGTQPCTFMWFLDMTKIKELEVRRRHPRPGHRDPSARHRRSQGVRRPGHQGQEHRPGQGEGAPQEGRLRAGRVRDQVPVRHRRRPGRRGEERDREGSRGRWLQGHPDRLQLGDHPHRPDRPEVPDQRPFQRMVLGLAVRRLVVPGPVVRIPGGSRGHAQPCAVQAGGHGQGAGPDPRHDDPRGGDHRLG
jgi:hypothetical protein